jgi:hypothetical protein
MGDSTPTEEGSADGSTTTVTDGGTLNEDVTPSTTTAGESSETTAGQTGEGESTTSVEDGPVTLVVSVGEGSCWLVVREDGENGAEIFAGTLSVGGKQTFDTARQYWMRIGNPEVLSVTVNGSPTTLAAPAGAFVVSGAGVERTQ